MISDDSGKPRKPKGFEKTKNLVLDLNQNSYYFN